MNKQLYLHMHTLLNIRLGVIYQNAIQAADVTLQSLMSIRPSVCLSVMKQK